MGRIGQKVKKIATIGAKGALGLASLGGLFAVGAKHGESHEGHFEGLPEHKTDVVKQMAKVGEVSDPTFNIQPGMGQDFANWANTFDDDMDVSGFGSSGFGG